MQTVLVVHPEKAIARLVEVNLARLGHQVRKAQDVDEALSVAAEHPIDVVVADPQLVALKPALRRNPATAHIRVLFLPAAWSPPSDD